MFLWELSLGSDSNRAPWLLVSLEGNFDALKLGDVYEHGSTQKQRLQAPRPGPCNP